MEPIFNCLIIPMRYVIEPPFSQYLFPFRLTNDSFLISVYFNFCALIEALIALEIVSQYFR